MVDEGETVATFELPAVRNGEFEQIALEEHLGEDVVVLAFYPGDFNPACDETSTGLDGLDLFTMQKDITILAISGDSVFSHRAFADEYDLHIPLLADVRGEVAAEYGVAADDERYLTRRAVFVVDHTEQVEYAWVADDIETVPSTDEIRAAIENIGDDQTAQARYRVGHAHYVEGRRAFTSAMSAFEDREWMLSSHDFAQAADEFDEAREEFNTAVRFSDDAEATRYFERAERKAEALWRAAGWLDDAASSFASGEGRRGDELRQDAEGPLETARDIHEPPNPDDFPPDEDPAERSDEEQTTSFLPSDDEEVDTTLDMDEPTDQDETATLTRGGHSDDGDPVGNEADEVPAEDAEDTGEIPGEAATSVDGEPESNIDDEELEAITAELEEQNDAQPAEADDPAEDAAGSGDDSPSASQSEESDVATVDDDVEDDDLELDLADPTDGAVDTDESDADEDGNGVGEDDEENDDEDDVLDDIGGGDHGVPDSL